MVTAAHGHSQPQRRYQRVADLSDTNRISNGRVIIKREWDDVGGTDHRNSHSLDGAQQCKLLLYFPQGVHCARTTPSNIAPLYSEGICDAGALSEATLFAFPSKNTRRGVRAAGDGAGLLGVARLTYLTSLFPAPGPRGDFITYSPEGRKVSGIGQVISFVEPAAVGEERLVSDDYKRQLLTRWTNCLANLARRHGFQVT
ncbi:hypothetical protein EVAR_79320_1 [Eumeta japonica]|uniref:Uncharacterized protein n=1 Tax=Eumeta variegata TaxID=151549 RepID=A0A4C1TFR2_EUMVA|nr:hypothetical protein EVAR_79320_1 [Eumeta japonica]